MLNLFFTGLENLSLPQDERIGNDFIYFAVEDDKYNAYEFYTNRALEGEFYYDEDDGNYHQTVGTCDFNMRVSEEKAKQLLTDRYIRAYLCDGGTPEDFIECEQCGELVYKDMISRINTPNEDFICDCCAEDFHVCDGLCGYMTHIDELTKTPNGDYLCPACYGESYSECAHCGEAIHKDDLADEDNSYCKGCYNELNPEDEEAV